MHRTPRRFTNLTRDFRGTLDYLLYTTDSLAPAAALELPDESECRSGKTHAGGCGGGCCVEVVRLCGGAVCETAVLSERVK